jgi:hypothetical protein
MTSLQLEMAISFAISATIIHLIVHHQWSIYFRKKVENDFEIYKAQLERAKERVNIIKRLHDEQKLIILMKGGNLDEYVFFCQELIEHCSEVAVTVNRCLKYNHHKITKGANMHLKKFSKHLNRKLWEMDKIVKIMH